MACTEELPPGAEGTMYGISPRLPSGVTEWVLPSGVVGRGLVRCGVGDEPADFGAEGEGFGVLDDADEAGT